MLRRVLILLFAAFTLAACGGGSYPSPQAMAVITTQPTDQSVVAGTPATFSVAAISATRYQWQRSSDGGATFADVAGATSPSHTTAATTLADSGTQYRVVVAGSLNSVTSSAAALTVTATAVAPAISVPPVNQAVTAGQNASFSVTATGTALSYQWQRSTDGGTVFADEAGASAAALNLAAVPLAHNGHSFRAVVSNLAGSVTSSAALLTVNAPTGNAPVFTTQPVSVSITDGQNTQFSVGVSGVPAPTLEWQVSVNNGLWFGFGVTTPVYTVNSATLADNGRQYRVVATNSAGTTISDAALLTVTAAATAPVFTTQPASVTISAGQSTQFTVAASGSPTPTFQWQLSTDGGTNWSNIVGQTGAVFNVLNAAQGNNGRQFRTVASNASGSANSNPATLTVNAAQVASAALAAGKLAAGPFHTCAIKADATVACWGHGSSGEVLPGNFSDQWTPQIVPGLSGMTYVAVGYQESCAIDTAGTLSCWGGGRSVAPIKDGNNVNYTGVKAVAMGIVHRCFIDAGTTVRCWGRNSKGQLGQGFAADSLVDPYEAVPVVVQRYGNAPLTDVVSLAAGDFHTCALRSDGEVVCWGEGAIGNGAYSALAAIVPAATSAKLIASGSGHACAVMAAGGVKCWGSNGSSELGNRNTTPQAFAVDVIDLPGLLSGVAALAAESNNTCAIPASGRVVCWGAVAPASLNGNLTYSPTEKGNLSARVTTMASGWAHSCALVSDGSIECWGSNQFGQLGLQNLAAINTGGPTPPSTSVIGGTVFWK